MPDIPLMFQAQIPERGKIQYAGDNTSKLWIDEWLKGCPPTPEPENSSAPLWKRKPSPKSKLRFPEFGANVKIWEYSISWRIVTDCGQDDGIIRPVIGAQGLPFFPGSSMKGAFRNACPPDLLLELCGGEVISETGEKTTQPGILRFHGGYPTNMAWGDIDQLVDLVHPQQDRQVMRAAVTSASVLISLYQPKFKFGISSSQLPPDSPRWAKIEEIWETALSYGLGSRVSAGYGYVDEIPSSDRAILSVSLKGQGLVSTLLNSTPEFRPNIFKATLRGHTLRILAGLIPNDKIVTKLNAEIWGDTNIEGEPVVGKVGIRFSCDDDNLKLGTFSYRNDNNRNVVMPIYDIQAGMLELLCMGEISRELEEFLHYIVRFAVLIGGFGKSCRRADHRIFFPSYLGGSKPTIGCHWELLEESYNQAVQINDNSLDDIGKFLDSLREKAIAWIDTQKVDESGYLREWREAWHKDKVQVWGRLAIDTNDSRAIKWLHQPYSHGKSIKGTSVTGRLGTVGRLWHRMYPLVPAIPDRKARYLELLTVFPKASSDFINFQEFLQSDASGFTKLWGNDFNQN